jgi:hypothetical protein
MVLDRCCDDMFFLRVTQEGAHDSCVITLGSGTGISGYTQHSMGANANFRGIQRNVDY